jgi:Domain of unknown function (DUF4157)/Putative RNase-like toxin, toxin_1
MSRAALQHAPQAAGKSAGTTTLRIGPAHDSFEQAADQAAEKVVSGEHQHVAWSLARVGFAPIQRQCSCGGTCDDCKKKQELLQRHASSSAAAGSYAPTSVAGTLSRPGSALDPGTRSFMESRFGHDFSGVRIHTGDYAAQSACDVSANAYTVGSSIVFNQGKYQPDTPSGRKLLAHELAHVVQQSHGDAPARIQRDASDIQVEEGPKSNRLLQQAFDAADARRWEVAARLANGLSPYEMKVFLSQYPQPIWRHYLHLGALNAPGVGAKSAIALATEKESAAYQKKEDFKYRQRLAKENGEPPPKEGDPAEASNAPKVLTAEQKKQKCASSDSKGIMTFPLRLPRGLWRISVAPINARREGKEIVVSQPLNGVLGDPMFKKEVKTLPLSTFTGGVHIAPDDYVRVRFYDDNDRVACISGEQMLQMSAASDTAVMLSIARTALDAASVLAPGAGEALVNRGFSAAAARFTVAGANLALNESLEVAQQGANVHYGIQDEIHWGQIAFETVLQAVTIGLGGKLSEAAAESVAGVATGTYTKPLLKAAVETVLQGSIAVVQGVAQNLFNRLQGEKKPMTFGDFMQELATQFAQGALLHLVMQAVPEGEGSPHTEEHGAPKTPKGTGEHLEPEAQRPVKQEHESAAPPRAKKQPAKTGMDPESAASPKVIPKEEAVATAEVEDPETHEQHEIVGSKKGIGRCSPKCPAISIVYAKELAEHPEFTERYKKIRELGETDITAATKQAAKLAREIEAYKKASALKSGAPITDLPKEITAAEAELNEARKSTRDYQTARKEAGKSLKGGPIKGIWNAKERLWILKRQQAYPDRTILEQARIVGVKRADGTLRPMSEISKTGRTPDYVELRGNKMVAGDLKSAKELLSSIDGGVGSEPIEGEFRESSKIAGQHKVENKVLKAAVKDQGVIVMQGRNVRTGEVQTIQIPVADYRSEVLTYEDVRPN